MEQNKSLTFLQKLLYCFKLLQMPIFEIIEFKSAFVLILTKIVNRFVAYILLLVSPFLFHKIIINVFDIYSTSKLR